MEFNKNQKLALGVVGGLLGLSWYMGNQFEKADMMRSENFRADDDLVITFERVFDDYGEDGLGDGEQIVATQSVKVSKQDYLNYMRKIVPPSDMIGDLDYFVFDYLNPSQIQYIKGGEYQDNDRYEGSGVHWLKIENEPEEIEQVRQEVIAHYGGEYDAETFEAEGICPLCDTGHMDSYTELCNTCGHCVDGCGMWAGQGCQCLEAETFEASNTKKPKLTPTQLKTLNMMKASTFYGGDRGNATRYAYVEIDNRGWKPYTTRPVQALIDKGIVTIGGGSRKFYGRVESMEAYHVYLNPVAWEYPFQYDSDKSLSQVGDKIVQNAKVRQQQHARILKQKQDEENMTEDEMWDNLFDNSPELKEIYGFGAETFEANEICHRSCYDGHEWRLSGTSHLGEYTTDGKPILNWRCDSCGQSKSSPEKPSSKADIHDWEMTRTKNWGDGVFTIYAECKRCGVKGHADGDVEESIDVQHPSLRAETFASPDDYCSDCHVDGDNSTGRMYLVCDDCGDSYGAETFNADGAYMRKTKSQTYENEKWGIFWDGDSRYRWYGISLIDNPNDVRIVAEYDANATYPYALSIPQPDEVKQFRTFNELLGHLDNMMERGQIGVFAHGVDGNRMRGRSKYPTVGDWTWYGAENFDAETMTPSEVKVKVTKDVTPKGSKIIVEECVDIQAHKADATANFYRVRFRDPSEMSNFRVPAWAARAANTMGSKYYDVAGSKVTMGQDKSGNWKIQSVMIPKRANVDVDLALKIANHIQDRLEKEGKWAPKKCQDNERVLVIR